MLNLLSVEPNADDIAGGHFEENRNVTVHGTYGLQSFGRYGGRDLPQSKDNENKMETPVQ